MIKFAKKKVIKENSNRKWKILIADDEEEVHNITKSVLSKFEFEHRNIDFLSAYSGKEALNIIKKNNDIALILLDVVMESDDAGLLTAKAIREDIDNNEVRIILRTGQPGSSPEKDIILNYDIDDYKEKTELTSTKLFTTVVTALRSYRNIELLKEKQKQLIKQSKFAAMGEIMDAVAHQWKQPLSTIMLSMDELLLREQLGVEVSIDDFKQVINKSKVQTTHLLNTIDEFRKMLKQDIPKTVQNIKETIDNTLILLKDSLMEYNINFKFIGDESLLINIIPSEFKHVLINLINNAKDELVSKEIGNKQIEFEWFKQENKMILLVKDNAGGIATNIIDKIFDVNFTTKDNDSGSGMGLYMSKMFCDKMNICISVSNLNEGACFTLEI